MRNRKLRNTLDHLPTALADPANNVIGRPAKTRQNLAACTECIPDEVAVCSKDDDLPLIDDRVTVAETFGLVHIVSGVDDRRACAAPFLDHFKNVVARVRVDTHRGLVHEDELWVMNE